jgi:mannose/cellobiose epimerase-like protein (N-acyl-D-glucosamine 2-epimerase family)
MRTVTPYNDPAALRLSTSCRSETIYGEIKALKLEQRLLTLRTLNHQELTVVLLPQLWAHELVNLGKAAKPLQDLNSDLVPGRWLMLRCIIYGSEQSLVLEAHELVLTSRDSVERLAHHPSWWRNQIIELADFYLRHLFGSSEQPKLDFFRYRTSLSLDGDALTDGRQESAVLSRLVYGFATAYLMTGRPVYLEAAQAGSAYLAEHFCQTDGADGLTYWVHGLEFQQDGRRAVILASEAGDDFDAIACYEQIYALAGLAQTFRATGDPALLDLCRSTIAFLRTYFRDSGPDGGYFSHIDPLTFNPLDDDLARNRARKNWNSIGDHVPAYLVQLYLGSGEEEFRSFLLELQDLLLTRFQPSDGSPFIDERFHADWTPDHSWGWQQNRTVVGHNLKIIWNLLRLQALHPDERTIPFCKALIEPVLTHGFDHLRGGWFDMVERRAPHHLCWHDRKAWWQQEQGILAFLELQMLEPSNPRWATYADASIDFYSSWFLDHEHGGVFFSVTADGNPWLFGQEGQKGGHSMGGYHAFELCLCASSYGNLVLRQETLSLHFLVVPDCLPNRILRVAPDLLPAGSVRLGSVLIDGRPWFEFNATDLTVSLPEGQDSVAVEVRLEPGVVNFELFPHPNTDVNVGVLTYGMRGYLCEYYLPIFRHRLEELETGVKLRLDASELTGACPGGLRYLTLLRQHSRHLQSLEIVNLPTSIQQDLQPFAMHT